MALRDTIYQIQARDSDLSAIASDRDGFISSWVSDLENLYELMQLFLKDLIDDGIVTIATSTHRLTEDELGEYDAPGLHLIIANRSILSIPVARLTSGGAGRVDLLRRDRPSELERIYIVRRRNTDGETPWMIERKGEPDPLSKLALGVTTTVARLMSRPARDYTPLNKTAFEQGLDFLLKNV